QVDRRLPMHLPVLKRGSRRGLRVAALCSVFVAMSLVFAGPISAQGTDLEVDEISHSENVRLVANVPRQGPLANGFHTDMAFWGHYLFQGSYDGINIYNIHRPQKPQLITQIYCPGSQGDVTVSHDGTLLF